MAHVGGMLALAAPGVIEQSATGQAPRRIGNRHPLFTPHGAFRCAGGNRWVVIAVTNDVQWRALCGEMGRADLAAIADRRSEEAAIEEAISGWTREQTPDEVMTALQAAGVPAGKVQNSVDILHDAHLASRGFWQHLERAYAGETTFASAPFREDAQPYRGRTPAPTLGEHNEIIFAGELKLSPEKLRALAARSVIGSQVVVEQKQKPVAAKEGVQ
jgi:crotonobetainyl-CoA:carnitine CoA-transferase CaiB-like acyl-CoA transferase